MHRVQAGHNGLRVSIRSLLYWSMLTWPVLAYFAVEFAGCVRVQGGSLEEGINSTRGRGVSIHGEGGGEVDRSGRD